MGKKKYKRIDQEQPIVSLCIPIKTSTKKRQWEKEKQHTRVMMRNELSGAERSRVEKNRSDGKRGERSRKEQKIDAVQVQCSPVNNRADTGGQEEMKHASATRKACENSNVPFIYC